MTKSHSDDARSDAITDDLRTVWASMQQLCVPTWLKLDLTMAQFKALVAVERHSGISVCEVGRDDIDWLGRLFEPKLHHMRIEEQLSELDVAGVFVKHGILEIPWRS